MIKNLQYFLETANRIGYFSLKSNQFDHHHLGKVLTGNIHRLWVDSEKDIQAVPGTTLYDFSSKSESNIPTLLLSDRHFVDTFRKIKNVEKSLSIAINMEILMNRPLNSLIRSVDNTFAEESYKGKFISTSYLLPSTSSNEVFNRIQRSKKIWWMKFYSNPGRILFSERKIFEKGHESISVLAKFDFGDLELERIEIVPTKSNDFLLKSGKRRDNLQSHLIQTETCLDISTMGIVFDAIDTSTSTSLPLHRKLVPYQCSVATFSQSNDPNLNDLGKYLWLSLKSAEILVPSSLHYKNTSMSDLDLDLCELDKIGVPYSLVLEDSTLKTGLLKLRSRDTGLSETIHLSDVPGYLVKIIKS